MTEKIYPLFYEAAHLLTTPCVENLSENATLTISELSRILSLFDATGGLKIDEKNLHELQEIMGDLLTAENTLIAINKILHQIVETVSH